MSGSERRNTLLRLGHGAAQRSRGLLLAVCVCAGLALVASAAQAQTCIGGTTLGDHRNVNALVGFAVSDAAGTEQQFSGGITAEIRDVFVQGEATRLSDSFVGYASKGILFESGWQILRQRRLEMCPTATVGWGWHSFSGMPGWDRGVDIGGNASFLVAKHGRLALRFLAAAVRSESQAGNAVVGGGAWSSSNTAQIGLATSIGRRVTVTQNLQRVYTFIESPLHVPPYSEYQIRVSIGLR